MAAPNTGSEKNIFVKRLWPGGKKFAISMAVDDVHPESSWDEEGLDYGGEMEKGNFGYLTELVSRISQLKVTLFIPPDWTIRPDSFSGSVLSLFNLVRRRRSYPRGRFRLDSEKQKDWCSWLKAKILTGNFEVAVHGLTHFSSSAPRAGLEFHGLSKEEAMVRISEAENIFKKAGIPFVKGFRPPGWHWSNELVQAVDSLGYLFFAGSSGPDEEIGPHARANGAGYPGMSLIYPDRIQGTSLISFSANTWEGQLDRARSIAKLGGLILIQTHIGPSAYGVRYLSSRSAARFANMVHELELEFGDVGWFASLRQIAERVVALDNVLVRSELIAKDACRLEVTNMNDIPVEGLSLTTNGANLAVPLHTPGVSSQNDSVCIGSVGARQSLSVTLPLDSSVKH